MLKVRMIIEGEDLIHYDGVIDEATLCGDMPEMDDRYPLKEEYTTKRVDCPKCIRVRNYVTGRKK